MLNSDLFTKLGVSEQALTKAILDQLGMTPEQAVTRLADQLGVKLPEETSAVTTGSFVQTKDGQARAAVISQADAQALYAARDTLNRILP